MSFYSSPYEYELNLVAQHLPFHLNETDKVNAAFVRWHQHDDEEAKYHIDLWTYCFIRRYFIVKFARDSSYSNVADVDALIEKAYAKVQRYESTIDQKARYASWVSVVCKNTFLNYLRTVHAMVSINQEDGPQLQGESLELMYDVGMMYEELQHAIERLPEFLRDVARLRFVEDCSYQEIGEATGKELPIVRSYVSKAALKLRSDPSLRSFLAKPGFK